MDKLLFLVLLLALGNLSRRLPAFPENTAQVLNQYVIWISFPATVLVKLNGIEIDAGLIMLPLVPWILLALSSAAVILIGRRLNWEKPLVGGVMLAVALGNTSFYGFPAVSAFFGDQYLAYAIVYDQLGSFLAVATFGTIVMSVYGDGAKVSTKGILFKIVTFPPFVALVLGFALSRTTIHPMIFSMLESLSATLIPLVIFSVGSLLRFRQPATNLKPIAITMILKMLILPIIAIGLMKVLRMTGPAFQITAFEAGMPSMVMAGVLAAAGNLRTDVVNAAIGYGILASFITLPCLYWIIRTITG